MSRKQLLPLPYLVQYRYIICCDALPPFVKRPKKKKGYWSWALLIRVAILVSSGREGLSRRITLSTYFTYLIYLSIYVYELHLFCWPWCCSICVFMYMLHTSIFRIFINCSWFAVLFYNFFFIFILDIQFFITF